MTQPFLLPFKPADIRFLFAEEALQRLVVRLRFSEQRGLHLKLGAQPLFFLAKPICFAPCLTQRGFGLFYLPTQCMGIGLTIDARLFRGIMTTLQRFHIGAVRRQLVAQLFDDGFELDDMGAILVECGDRIRQTRLQFDPPTLAFARLSAVLARQQSHPQAVDCLVKFHCYAVEDGMVCRVFPRNTPFGGNEIYVAEPTYQICAFAQSRRRIETYVTLVQKRVRLGRGHEGASRPYQVEVLAKLLHDVAPVGEQFVIGREQPIASPRSRFRVQNVTKP